MEKKTYVNIPTNVHINLSFRSLKREAEALTWTAHSRVQTKVGEHG